jgi:N6-L-threonylcarbamoyladenine synthase
MALSRFSKPVRILGIESSCDETAAAVVEDGEIVLSSVVASQMITHGKYGGVVPELASREHLRAIVPVVREALDLSGTRLEDLAAIAATVGPGLVGSLLVGLTYAKSLSFASGVPLIAVNHIEGHIHAVVLEARRAGTPVEFPAVALVVSGGHTHLFEVRQGFEYRLLGRTRDDAAGEAFDKVAKLLGYCYPGGPVVDQLSPHGDPAAVRFTFAKMKGNTLDFSFSGLKTAVLRWVESHDMQAEIAARRPARKSVPHSRAVAGRHAAAHAGPFGFVPTRRDRGVANARRRRRRKHRGSLAHRLRRCGLQLGPARRGQGSRLAVPGLFPFRRSFHR